MEGNSTFANSTLEIEEYHKSNDTLQIDEKRPFDGFVKTLSTEVKVQFWVLVLFGLVIFVVVLGEFDIFEIEVTFNHLVRCGGCCCHPRSRRLSRPRQPYRMNFNY